MKMSAGVADLIISRAGSTIFQIAVWGVPSIIIPITNSNGDHQRKTPLIMLHPVLLLLLKKIIFQMTYLFHRWKKLWVMKQKK